MKSKSSRGDRRRGAFANFSARRDQTRILDYFNLKDAHRSVVRGGSSEPSSIIDSATMAPTMGLSQLPQLSGSPSKRISQNSGDSDNTG